MTTAVFVWMVMVVIILIASLRRVE